MAHEPTLSLEKEREFLEEFGRSVDVVIPDSCRSEALENPDQGQTTPSFPRSPGKPENSEHPATLNRTNNPKIWQSHEHTFAII